LACCNITRLQCWSSQPPFARTRTSLAFTPGHVNNLRNTTERLWKEKDPNGTTSEFREYFKKLSATEKSNSCTLRALERDYYRPRKRHHATPDNRASQTSPQSKTRGLEGKTVLSESGANSLIFSRLQFRRYHYPLRSSLVRFFPILPFAFALDGCCHWSVRRLPKYQTDKIRYDFPGHHTVPITSEVI